VWSLGLSKPRALADGVFYVVLSEVCHEPSMAQKGNRRGHSVTNMTFVCRSRPGALDSEVSVKSSPLPRLRDKTLSTTFPARQIPLLLYYSYSTNQRRRINLHVTNVDRTYSIQCPLAWVHQTVANSIFSVSFVPLVPSLHYASTFYFHCRYGGIAFILPLRTGCRCSGCGCYRGLHS
jgi:hypothetical protein